MSERIYLSELRLNHREPGYRLFMRCQDAKIELQVDKNLGVIMSAFSAGVKELLTMLGYPMPATRQTEMRVGTVTLEQFRIDPLFVAPYRWQLVMESGPYKYTCNLDRDLEHVILGFAGAMKFFALKYGTITLDEDVARNSDRAREAGLDT